MTANRTEQATGKRLLAASRTFLWFWWISWLGIIGGFFLVGGQETWRELSQDGAALPFSLTLLIVIPVLWTAFLIADSKVKERARMVALLTTVGTILAILTLIGIFFFVDIAPRMK